MTYAIVFSGLFGKQIDGLDKDAKHILGKKMHILKENPFRYKRLRAPGLHLY